MTFIYQLKTVCSFKVRTFVSRHFNFWNMDIASLIYTEEGYSWGFPENMKSTLQCSICIFPGDRWPVMPEILILQLYHGITTLPTVCKGIHFLPLVGSLLWERLWNHFGSQQNMKRKGNIFKAANVKSLEHLLAGQWVKKTQMEKSQSVYALVWSPMFSPVFFSSFQTLHSVVPWGSTHAVPLWFTL